jgi:AcrR family transcriptional regulator
MSQVPSIPGLIDAAARLLSRSQSRFTLGALAREVGISRSTLYRVFPSRKALLAHLEAEGITTGPAGVRGRILAAAVRAYEDLGLHDATIEEIARRAGVAPVTIYRQFGDRARLLDATMEESSPRRAARALALRPSENLEGDLARFAAIGLAFLAEHKGVLRLALGASPNERERLRKLRRAPRGATAAVKTWCQRQMARGRLPKQDAHRLAVAFSGLLVSFAYVAPLFEDLPLEDPNETGRMLARLFLRGALAGPARTE